MADSLRTRFVVREPGTIIVSEQARKDVRNHSRLKLERDKELEALRDWRKEFGSTPLLIRSPITLGPNIPAASPIETSRTLALSLIMRSLTVPVGDMSIQPLLVIDDEAEVDGTIVIKLLIDVESMKAGTIVCVPRDMGQQLIEYDVAEPSTERASVFVAE